jgi:hypothetical protein
MCRLELAIRRYPNHIRHPTWVRDQTEYCEALAKEFNDLPWDEYVLLLILMSYADG